jgi:hypothetical protein
MSWQFDFRELLDLPKQCGPYPHPDLLERYSSPLDGDRTVNVVQSNTRSA